MNNGKQEKAKPGTFKPGNQAAVGRSNPSMDRKFITRQLLARLKEVDASNPEGKDNAAVIVDKLVELAKQGEQYAVSMIYERIEGKTVQPISGTVTHQFDLSRFSTAELMKFRELARKAAVMELPAEEQPPKIIDVTPDKKKTKR